MPLGPRPRLTPELTAIAVALLMLSMAAQAQTAAPAADAGLERAQKAADAVFHWIKLNGDKGANRQPPASPAPAPTPRKPAPVAAAPKPVQAAVQRNAPAPPEASAPMPPVVAAAEPQPQAQTENAAVLLAAAAPTPPPAAPMALAAQAVPPPHQDEAEVPLKLLSRVNPSIPKQLQTQTFRTGFARVKFTVAPDGSVSGAESIEASHARLASAAINAVRQWRFAPIPAAREAAIEFAFNNGDE